MNYFTPELLSRYGAADDRIADAASAEWEEKHEAYLQHLTMLRPRLPRSVVRLLDRQCLHDANVLTIVLGERPSFSIVLELDGPEQRWLELRYRLPQRSAFQVVRHSEYAEEGKPLQWWLYDEFEVVQQDPVPLFRHSILLSGGWELQVPFLDLRCWRLRGVLAPSAAANGAETPDELAALLK